MLSCLYTLDHHYHDCDYSEQHLVINTKIEMKKLKFHTPGNGKSKCFKLHIGKKNKYCPDLLVHGAKMSPVGSQVYLRDIISSNGQTSDNISHRISKATGIIS